MNYKLSTTYLNRIGSQQFSKVIANHATENTIRYRYGTTMQRVTSETFILKQLKIYYHDCSIFGFSRIIICYNCLQLTHCEKRVQYV